MTDGLAGSSSRRSQSSVRRAIRVREISEFRPSVSRVILLFNKRLARAPARAALCKYANMQIHARTKNIFFNTLYTHRVLTFDFLYHRTAVTKTFDCNP